MFCSGAAALIYQVIWQRVLSQEIGIDSAAVAIVVAVFMMGLGFGSLYGGRFTRKYPHLLPVIYALMEVGIGVYGWFANDILRGGNQLAASILVPNLLFDFIINLGLLIVPVFIMGMSTPVIMDMLKRSLTHLGRLIGVFYGANILGAATGALVCGLYMIEMFGLNQSVQFAAYINFGIAAVALLIAPFWYMARKEKLSAESSDTPLPKIERRYIYAALCFGFSTLAAQMILFRILFYLYRPVPTLFPVILAAYLVMMALGELIIGYLCDKSKSTTQLQRMSYSLLLGAMMSFLVVFTLPVTQMASNDFLSEIDRTWIYIIGAMVPIAFLAGYLPLLLKIITQNLQDVAPNFGFILGISTLGNVLGVFITTVLLFGLIGTWGSFLITLLVVLVGCILINDDAYSYAKSLWSKPPEERMASLRQSISTQPWLVFIAGALLVTASALPYGFYKQPFGEFKPLGFIEGYTGVMTAVPFTSNPDNYVWLFTSRRHAARTNVHEPSPLNTTAMTRLMAFDPNYRPQKVVQIGMGDGLFHYANKSIPFMQQVDIVEISSEVITGFKRYTKSETLAASFNHPKVDLHVMDGRRFMRHAVARGTRYDLVQIGVQYPNASGASNLYTKEMFELTKQALKPGGYLVLIGYTGLARTALEVFNTVFWFERAGRTWVYATDKTFDDLPSKLTVPIDPWLGKLYTAGRASDMDFGKLEEFVAKRPLEYKPFNVYFFDQEWLKDTYDVNRDDRLIYEYNLLARRKKDYINQNAFFGSIDYKARKIEVNVIDSKAPAVIPENYEDILPKE